MFSIARGGPPERHTESKAQSWPPVLLVVMGEHPEWIGNGRMEGRGSLEEVTGGRGRHATQESAESATSLLEQDSVYQCISSPLAAMNIPTVPITMPAYQNACLPESRVMEVTTRAISRKTSPRS